MRSQIHHLARLREQLRQAAEAPQYERFSSGCDALDRWLPRGGFRRGGLVEWLGEPGCGATSLALLAAREACGDGGDLMIVDADQRFYPPAAADWGFAGKRVSFVFPATRKDFEWAVHQALDCPAVSAVLCWPRKIDDRTLRRWQLAAERGGSVGFLVRPVAARGDPTWADARLSVAAAPQPGEPARRRLLVTLLHCRLGGAGQSIELEWDDETHTLHLAARLAAATVVSRATGA